MLDQSSAVGDPLHLVVAAPIELQTRYAADHPDVAEFISSLNQLAAAGDPEEQRAGRDRLAERADGLQRKYTEQSLSELAPLLGYAAVYLRGHYPLRAAKVLPTINLGE